MGSKLDPMRKFEVEGHAIVDIETVDMTSHDFMVGVISSHICARVAGEFYISIFCLGFDIKDSSARYAV